MKKIVLFYKKCRSSGTNFIWLLIRAVFYKITYGKILLLHQRVSLRGIKNIHTQGRLEIGTDYVGFMHPKDRTFLNIKGSLSFAGGYNIGRGCRIDIEEGGSVTIGHGGYINTNTSIIIMHGLSIGDNCVISWNCQFLDEDFHSINYEGRLEGDPKISIGDRVWVGCGVKIYKGTQIADGCVVDADSVVRGQFTQANTLIGGNPARVIKENISWQ
jgi:acetyltransferase-like isoleucine patch superfamily enzyme